MDLKLFKDTRGYTCGRCRRRLYPKTKNVAGIQCPSCERVTSSNPRQTNERTSNNKLDGRFSSTEFYVVAKIKEKFLRRHHREDSDTEKPKPLNWSPSPLESSSTSLSYPRPRKRALLIGVTYKKSKHKLTGTVNDVRNIRSLLIESFCFHPQSILILTEDETEPHLTPTKKNIEISLKWLVQDCQYGDSLVFFFSGHGSRQRDFNFDERDGFDETICPVDFLKEGIILDNYINSTIAQPLPPGVILHAIVDSCYSGTILDLVHVYNREKQWEDNSPPNGTRKHTNGGFAISISACEDNQMAADTGVFTEKERNGALTYILVEIVKKRPGATYGDLLDMIHETIDAVNNSGSLFSKILRSKSHEKLLQKPQLSASEPFDVMRKHFIL
ncbi:metacaspase-1 isoform X2 [Hevea brasiliensis]|uniref:metacaspase-1 isoform X2 n=1 Tax=Hevea brasiliensis TaxID=3981 RepID=UPI0025EDAFC6|nr:metacaspase-1 isoform X2 [Hevea brasiliensis]